MPPPGGEEGTLFSVWAAVSGQKASVEYLGQEVALFSRVRCGVDVGEGDGAGVRLCFSACGVARKCSGCPSKWYLRAERRSESVLRIALVLTDEPSRSGRKERRGREQTMHEHSILFHHA